MVGTKADWPVLTKPRLLLWLPSLCCLLLLKIVVFGFEIEEHTGTVQVLYLRLVNLFGISTDGTTSNQPASTSPKSNTQQQVRWNTSHSHSHKHTKYEFQQWWSRTRSRSKLWRRWWSRRRRSKFWWWSRTRWRWRRSLSARRRSPGRNHRSRRRGTRVRK